MTIENLHKRIDTALEAIHAHQAALTSGMEQRLQAIARESAVKKLQAFQQCADIQAYHLACEQIDRETLASMTPAERAASLVYQHKYRDMFSMAREQLLERFKRNSPLLPEDRP